jgi:hypothetical protein
MMTLNPTNLDEQVPFYIKRLKSLRHNGDRTLKINFYFEGERDGLFAIRNPKENDPYYGVFKITTDSVSNGVRIDLHCSGFYVSTELKVERANQYQYSEHKVVLDKKLTPLTRLHQRIPKRKRVN